MMPHTLTNSEEIQNLTIKPKNNGNPLLGQEGATSLQLFCLEETPSMLLFSKLKESLTGKTFG
jgi:hypothetical protein